MSYTQKSSEQEFYLVFSIHSFGKYGVSTQFQFSITIFNIFPVMSKRLMSRYEEGTAGGL